MSYTPKISIITSVYNGEKYLEECIRSIAAQRYPNVEYIIIDGGSTDNTTGIIRQYESKLHYWVSEKDKGIYQAWNKGLARATGEWIAFVGSDDILWDDQVIEKAIPDLQSAIEKGIRFVYGRVNLLSSQSKVIKEMGDPWEIAETNILDHMTVTHCGAFHHRSLFEEHGRFDESFRIIGDYDFLLREFTKGGKARFVDRIFAGMHAGGISANLRSKLTLAREHVRARSLNHLPPTFRSRIQLIKAHTATVLMKILGERMIARLSDMYRLMKGKERVWTKID